MVFSKSLGTRARSSSPRRCGSLAGSITIGEDFEFSDEEIDAMLDDPE